jgi:surfactin synthase thioesterase subunit
MADDWLSCRSRRPDATHRLYCFPFAGSSAGDFVRWSELLPDVEVLGIVPPGRGMRFAEPRFDRLTDLVSALVAEVTFRPPFALFGHSLGATLAFETGRALAALDRPPPDCLIVSGHRPPHRPPADESIHHLPPEEFAALARQRYPAPPPELAEDAELYAELLETLRCDLAVFETYQHQPATPLACPIIVVSGVGDHWSAADLAGWRQHTSAGCEITMIPGDHFYLTDHGDDVVRIIATALRP